MPTFPDRPSVQIPLTACEREWFRPASALPAFCHPASIDRREHLRSVADLEALLARTAASHQNVFVFHPLASLCPAGEERCSTQRGASMIFSDSNHLTNRGVSLLEAPFLTFLRQIEQQTQSSRPSRPGPPAS